MIVCASGKFWIYAKFESCLSEPLWEIPTSTDAGSLPRVFDNLMVGNDSIKSGSKSITVSESKVDESVTSAKELNSEVKFWNFLDSISIIWIEVRGKWEYWANRDTDTIVWRIDNLKNSIEIRDINIWCNINLALWTIILPKKMIFLSPTKFHHLWIFPQHL